MLRNWTLIALAVAGLVALTQGKSAASEVPRLRQVVSITGDLVRIGDLVDNAGDVADVAIFRSPDVGVTGTLSSKQVLDAVRQYDLLIVDTAGVSAITVTRSAREMQPREIARRIAESLAERYRLANASMLDINFDREPRTLHVEPQAINAWHLERSGYDPRSGRFEIVFGIPGNLSATQGSQRYSGFVVEMTEVAVLHRPINRGEIIMAADTAVERRKKSEAPPDAAVSIEDVVGLAARQPLRAGQPLRRADLVKPEVIKRDDLVTLFYEVPGIMLTVRGKALANGAEGDVINVLNVQSKRTVQGVVDGRGRVIVDSITPMILTENVSASADRQRK